MFPFLRCLTAFCFLVPGLPLSADEVIRIMAANTTSGNFSSYDPGEGNRIFQGLDPQIVMVQEMNVGTGANRNTVATYRAWVTANFGSSFSYYAEPGETIPNGIVSAYPILESGEWADSKVPNRDYVWARIDIPGDKDLWAISVHLYTDNSSDRAAEANEIKAAMLAKGIPTTDYVVIGGDFNTDSRGEACVSNLSAVFVTSSPYPADQSGNGNTNASRAKPYDWVMANPTLDSREITLSIGTSSFPNGLVFDSRVYSPLSAVAPVMSGDSGASMMQHMAVMRAFLIPTNDPPVIASAANSASTETVTDPDSSVYEIVRGTAVGLTVSATDDGGEAALKYTWSKTAGAASPVGFSANGTNAAKNSTVTFQAIGNYTLTATIADSAGLTATSSIKVRVVQTAASLALNPPTATLAVNATQDFTASLLDQFGQALASQPASFTWSANGGGTINSSGLFTATTAGGPFVVSAGSGGFSDTSGVTVTKAAATLVLTNLTPVYDGNPKPAAVDTTPPGLAVTLQYDGSPTPPANAGSYAVIATISDPNYQGSSSGTLTLQKATATITLSGLAATYDGNPKPVTAETAPPGLNVAILYEGLSPPPVNAGSYAISASITEANYQGTASGTLVIAPDEWALWKNTYFDADERSSGLAADDVDADSDGLVNLAEYSLDTNPRAFTPSPPGVPDAAGISITFTRPLNRPDILYAAEGSDDLDDWSPAVLEYPEGAPAGTLRASVPFGEDPSAPLFLRLRFTRQ